MPFILSNFYSSIFRTRPTFPSKPTKSPHKIQIEYESKDGGGILICKVGELDLLVPNMTNLEILSKPGAYLAFIKDNSQLNEQRMAPDVGLVLAPAYVEAAFVVLIDKLFYATLPSGVDPKDKDFKYLVNQAPRIEALKEMCLDPGGLIQAFWEQRDEYAKSVHGCKSIKLHHSTQYFKAPIHKINFLDPLGSIWGFVNAEVQNHNSTQATLKDEHDEGPVDDFKDDKSKDRRQFTLQVVDDADRGDFFDITNSITANTIADFAFESLGHELRDNSLGLVPPPSKPVEENRDYSALLYAHKAFKGVALFESHFDEQEQSVLIYESRLQYGRCKVDAKMDK